MRVRVKGQGKRVRSRKTHPSGSRLDLARSSVSSPLKGHWKSPSTSGQHREDSAEGHHVFAVLLSARSKRHKACRQVIAS